ncbi:uncharacterized protein BDZ99DRAFT_464535 [Mytilinidion resinicola]|uniref:Integral membrane protein n=1 Tax=Mytilinidion resinicola TaxID=574789 RepID=A0A6A6YG77_9PEZI|nr:uncharacterized protein BDZ99DRAFT_464535 [Mytilinidion resinicola]KAF2807599.1 hypothetical protein BDZ99DRAFT_464535 [Mytilinidion resinicola]
MPPNKLLLAASVLHTLLSAGHTAKGLEMFKDPAFARLPALLTKAVQAGWFEGSVFFAILGLINYRWAHSGLADSTELGVAGLISLLCFGAGGWYAKSGDKQTGVLLAAAGVLQAVGVRSVL